MTIKFEYNPLPYFDVKGPALRDGSHLNEVITDVNHLMALAVSGGSISTNIVNILDYGPPGTDAFGGIEIEDSLVAFTAAWQGKEVYLYFPPGTYSFFNSDAGTAYFGGIPKIKILAYGTSMGRPTGINTGGMVRWGAVNQVKSVVDGSASTARLASAAKGATTLTLLNAGDASKFVPGTWALITAFDLQGFGSPPNPYFFEYVKIISIVGTTITLNFALRNSYSSTYGTYDPGDTPDQGGPATLYALDPTWDTEIEVCGVHFLWQGFISVFGRSVTYTDCTFEGEPLPSGHRYFELNRCNLGSIKFEIDKTIESLVMRKCDMRGFDQSSASIDRMVIDDCQIGKFTVQTSKNTKISNSTLQTLAVGPLFYGPTTTLLVENCRIENFDWNESVGQNISLFTASHGVLTKTAAGGNPFPWPPGTKMLHHGAASGKWAFPFVITDVSQDGGGHTVISTTLPDPLPVFSGTVIDQYFPHPCARATFINCVGCEEVINLSNGGNDRPILTYSRALYTGGLSSPANLIARGDLVKIRFNVLRAYTGVSGTLTLNFAPNYLDNTLTQQTWTVVVNLKTAGERVVTPGSVTGTVAGDSIPVLSAGSAWLLNGLRAPTFSASIGGEAQNLWPLVEVEVQTSHGLAEIDVVQTGSTKFVG